VASYQPHAAGDSDDTTKGVRAIAAVVGIVFLLVGILGFIPGITTHYGDLSFAGHHSRAELLGIFQVSVLHNIVHLLFGVAGLALARTARTAVAYLIGGGLIYLVLWVYGLAVGEGSSANFVPVNSADNWLHLVLGIGMVGLGLMGRRQVTTDPSAHVH
jgi:ABC-type transport system involved in multi-copper enzyme maturation permease subunit